MSDDITWEDNGNDSSVRFACGGWPADQAVADAGHEPNGYFWEGVLQFLDEDAAGEVELDSESGMFAAYGASDATRRVKDLLAPLLNDADAVADLIARAEAEGFEFDD